MKNPPGIGRRELFRKLAGSAGAAALAAIPRAAVAQETPTPGSGSAGSATVRVILANGTTVQWLAVTSGGLTVGGTTTISTGPPGLNKRIVQGAITAIVNAGGPHLTSEQVTLLGGKSS